MKKIAILGSTGSIGTQTLEIVRTNGDLEVTALAAGNNIDLLEKQIREFKPKLAAVWKEERANELKDKINDLDVKVVSGMDGLLEVARQPESEILVTAIVGMIGILPKEHPTRQGIEKCLQQEVAHHATGIDADYQILLDDECISDGCLRVDEVSDGHQKTGLHHEEQLEAHL